MPRLVDNQPHGIRASEVCTQCGQPSILPVCLDCRMTTATSHDDILLEAATELTAIAKRLLSARGRIHG